MAGKAVYLREEEILLIHQMFRAEMGFRDSEELERIRKEIEQKMSAALYAIETK